MKINSEKKKHIFIGYDGIIKKIKRDAYTHNWIMYNMEPLMYIYLPTCVCHSERVILNILPTTKHFSMLKTFCRLYFDIKSLITTIRACQKCDFAFP